MGVVLEVVPFTGLLFGAECIRTSSHEGMHAQNATRPGICVPEVLNVVSLTITAQDSYEPEWLLEC